MKKFASGTSSEGGNSSGAAHRAEPAILEVMKLGPRSSAMTFERPKSESFTVRSESMSTFAYVEYIVSMRSIIQVQRRIDSHRS